MQNLESSIIGLRSARIELASPENETVVTLFPMIHIGDSAFYEAIRAETPNYGAVLYEGVNGWRARLLISSYRAIPDATRLGLVRQSDALPKSSLGPHAVHADLTEEEFAAAWDRAPFGLRFALMLLSPIYGLYRRHRATRTSIASARSMDDKFSSEEILSWSQDWQKFDNALIHDRDARLLAVLDENIGGSNARSRDKIAIVFGAAHMRAVLDHLLCKRGFVVQETRWMTVISLTN